MAARCVMLGPVVDGRAECVEVTPSDAAAYVRGSKWRVSFTLYAGDLADATVIVPEQNVNEAEVWGAVRKLSGQGRFFSVPVPIPLAEALA